MPEAGRSAVRTVRVVARGLSDGSGLRGCGSSLRSLSRRGQRRGGLADGQRGAVVNGHGLGVAAG
jgi:hypothetical protein